MAECKQCGNEYEAKRKTSKYCSAKCKQLAYRNKDRVTPVTVTPLSVTPVIPQSVTVTEQPVYKYGGELTKERQVRAKGFNG